MAYEEYDYYNEPSSGSLKDSLYQILNGLQDRTKLREAGTSLKEALQLTPNVTESLGRGGVAQAIGTSGDLRELQDLTHSPFSKGFRNFTRAAQFLANPYATAIQQTAPTTEQTLDFVPRVSAPYEGYKQHETLGEYVAPALGYLGGKLIKATKDLPIGNMIIGENSLHPNFKAKELAEELEKKNADPIQIWDATGLMRGSDKKWRTEISDQFSKLKENPLLLDKERFTDKNYSDFGALYDAKLRTPGSYGRVHISDVFESPELEKYYPHLFDKRNPNGVTIKLAPEDARYMGRVEDEGRTIAIRPGIKAEDARRILNHELQHIVQKYEGHATGGSVDTFTQQEDAKIAAQALSIRGEAERMDPNVPWPERVKASYVLHRGLGMDFFDEARRVAENVAFNPTKDMENLTTLYGTDKNIEPYSPTKMYEKIGGEAEARLTEARMDMTDAERAQNFPFEYTPRTYDENLRPNPITGFDVRPEEQIIHGHKPNTIDIGGKRIFGTPDQAKPESVEIPKSEPDRMGFHSPLENLINNLKNPKGTGEQFLRQFEKDPTIKADELDMTGLKKYLQEHKTVTKEELQNYMKENRVELDQIVKGEATEDGYGEYELRGGENYHDQDYIDSLAEDLHSDLVNDPDVYHQTQEELVERFPELYKGHELEPDVAARLNNHVDEVLREQAQQQSHDMYYDNPITHHYDDYGYDIYGNDDVGYSIKDPSGRFLDFSSRNPNGIYDIGEAEDALRGHLLDEGVIDIGDDGAKHEAHSLSGNYDNYREVLVTLPEQYKKGTRDWMYESHYDEPNILGHVRLDDRTINGKKTLFVEEVQSDWHQHGRDEGYQDANYDAERQILLDDLNDLTIKKSSLRKDYDNYQKTGNFDKQNELSKQIAEIEKQQVKIRQQMQDTEGKVPDAPYKKTWHEMLMKQVMDIAAKENYDAIAFTTGKQQNDRYNLAKYIENLTYNPETNQLFGYKKDGYSPVISEKVEPDKLADYVGADVAKRLLQKELTSVNTTQGVEYHQQLSGLDLESGGEPMKKFYDRDIPNFVNKYAKKWGMGMKKANLSAGDNNYYDFREWVIKQDPSLHESYIKDLWERKSDVYQDYRKSPDRKGEEVHFVELTDAAKKDIKEKGQPMFAGIGALGGTDYLLGSDDQQKTGILKDLMKQKY
jgi:hypothetical protein